MKKLVFAALIAGSLLNVSCKKDPADAPTLPPSTSMDIDFSNFQEDGKTDSTAVDTTKFDHWGRAAIQAGVWNIVLTVNLAVPVLSFKEAFNHTPSYASKNEGWLWTYTVTNASGTYTAKLYGKIVGDSNEWRMLISKAGAFTDVEWYTGTSKNDNSGGSWKLNKNAFNVTEYLNIDWSRSGTKEEIKYTLVEAGIPEYGSYIEYGVDSSLTMDAFYNIYAAKDNHSVDIKWNRTTKEGNVVEPAHYGDNDPRCWDTTLHNTVCN